MKWLAPSRRADGSTVAHGSYAVCSPQEEEPAMEHCAIDLGGRKSQVCVRASDGTIVHESRPETLALKEFLQGRPKSRVIVETCAEAFGVADAALALGHEVRVVSATLVRTLGVGARRTKTDRRDAQTLSEVSCRIDLPSVHVPGHCSRKADQHGTRLAAGPGSADLQRSNTKLCRARERDRRSAGTPRSPAASDR